MGNGRGKRSGDHPPLYQKLAIRQFFPYRTHLSLWTREKQKSGRWTLESPNSKVFTLVYVASLLLPGRWTHEDQLEVVADTTENCMWVVNNAWHLGRMDVEAPGGPGSPVDTR